MPGLGWALKGVVGYTATQAMGKTAVAYFERGAPLETGRVTQFVKGFRSTWQRNAERVTHSRND